MDIDVEAVKRILAEEPILPSEWTGAHVGARMIDAFRTLSKFPRVGHQSPFKHVIMEVIRDTFAEELSILALPDKNAPAFRTIRPSPREIRLMDEALEWPMTFIPDDQATRHCVLIWAHGVAVGKAQGRVNERVRLRYHLSAVRFHEARLRGCMTIAACLTRDGIQVE